MKHFIKLVRPYIVWGIVMIILPLLLILLYSVTTGGNDLVNIQCGGIREILPTGIDFRRHLFGYRLFAGILYYLFQ